MHRRRLLSLGVAGLATGIAGCQSSTEEPTSTPTPSESLLRIRVENETDTTREVSFQLDVTTPGPDTGYLFGLRDVQPGTTRETERDLPAGRYELRIEFDSGETTIQWSGNECSEKLVTIRYTDRGIVFSDRCPESE